MDACFEDFCDVSVVSEISCSSSLASLSCSYFIRMVWCVRPQPPSIILFSFFFLFRCAELQTKLFSFIQIIEDTHSFLFLSSSLPSFVISTSICIYSPPASLPLSFFFCLFSLSLALCLCLCVYHYPNTFFFL
jgi:hypothetical protein